MIFFATTLLFYFMFAIISSSQRRNITVQSSTFYDYKKVSQFNMDNSIVNYNMENNTSMQNIEALRESKIKTSQSNQNYFQKGKNE